MTNLQALREKIANLANQANHILAEKGSQTWSTEDQTKFDNLTDEIERAKGRAKAESTGAGICRISAARVSEVRENLKAARVACSCLD